MFGAEFFAAFEAVFTIIILIAVGYILTAKGKITKEISKFLTWIVMNISLPCLMASTILKNFNSEDIKTIPKAVIVPLCTIIICLIIGFFITKIINPKPERFGQMVVQTALSNTIFMGLPINIALFGENSVPFVLYYYIANTIIFWTLGVYFISGGRSKNEKNIFSVLLTPPMYGLIVGLLCLIFHYKPPQFALSTLDYIGNLTTPLSMFFVGYVLCTTGLKNLKIDKDVILGILCRLGIGPAISIIFFSLAGLPNLMFNVYTIQSFMPVVTNTAVVAANYDTDSEYAAVMITTTTIISLILIPLVKVFIII